MLDATLESVNSALKRARSGLQRRLPNPVPQVHSPRDSQSEQAIVARFVSAYESADLDALVELFTDDVFMAMPPIALEYEGRALVGEFVGLLFGAGRRFSLVPTRANGQPAFGAYIVAADGSRQASGLFALTLIGDRISSLTRFEAHVLARFGLPLSLPSQ